MLIKTFLILMTLSLSEGRTDEDCGENIIDNSGTIQSPHYALAYPTSTACIWRFKTVQTEEYVLVFQINEIRMYYYANTPTGNKKVCTGSLKFQSNIATPDEVDCKSYESEAATTCYTYRSSDDPGCLNLQQGSDYVNCKNENVQDSKTFEMKFNSSNDPGMGDATRRFTMTYEYVSCLQGLTKASTSNITPSPTSFIPSSTKHAPTPSPTSHLATSSKPFFTSSSASDHTLCTALNLASSTSPPPMSVVPIVIGSLFAILVLIAIAVLVVIRRKRAKFASKDEKKQPSSASDYDELYNSTSLKNKLSDDQISTNGSQKADDDEGLYSQLQRDGKVNQAYSLTENQPNIPNEGDAEFTNEEPSDENPYHHLVRDLSSNVKDSQLEKDGEINQTNNPASQYEVVNDSQINESFTDGDQADENPYHQLLRDMPADGGKLQEFDSVQEVVDNDYDHLQSGILHDNQGNQACGDDFKPEDTYDHLVTGLSNPRLSQANSAPRYEAAADIHPSKHNPNISQYEEILDLKVSRQNSSPATNEEQNVIQPSAPTENYTQIIPKSERASEKNRANA